MADENTDLTTQYIDLDFTNSWDSSWRGLNLGTSAFMHIDRPFYTDEFELSSDQDWCQVYPSYHSVGLDANDRHGQGEQYDNSCCRFPDINEGYFGFSIKVAVNYGDARTAIVTIKHIGGFEGTMTITQESSKILLLSDISEDAFQDVIPGQTPWFETYNQQNFPDWNWGRAEKVLYMTVSYNAPSAGFYVPESWISDDTNIKFCVDAATDLETAANTFGSWVREYYYEPKWYNSSNHESFKWRNYDIGPTGSNVTPQGKERYTTFKFTIVLCNYNGQIGNMFAVPFRIVCCKSDITQDEFDELVNLYGVSNYDGTMNELSRFNFDTPDPSTPSTPNTPSNPEPEFTGNLTFRESEMNVPATAYTNVAILNAKGLKKTDLSKVSIASSVSWISNIVKTYKTNINGDAYLWITFKTDENEGDARTGNIEVSINGKTAVLKINQVAAEDSTTDTTNDLTTVPRFDGENNISVKSDAKTNTATLNVWEMTEQECNDKVTVRTNAAWIKNINIKYVKKDK